MSVVNKCPQIFVEIIETPELPLKSSRFSVLFSVRVIE